MYCKHPTEKWHIMYWRVGEGWGSPAIGYINVLNSLKVRDVFGFVVGLSVF